MTAWFAVCFLNDRNDEGIRTKASDVINALLLEVYIVLTYGTSRRT